MGKFLYLLSLLSTMLSIGELVYISFRPPTKEQKAFSVTATVCILLNIGTMMSVIASSTDASTAGIVISYFGGAFLSYAFIFVLGVIIHTKPIPFVRIGMLIGNFIFIAAVLFEETRGWYYKVLYYLPRKGMSSVRVVWYGPMFYAYVAWHFMYLVVSFVMLIRAAKTRPVAFKRMKKLYLSSAFTGLGVFLVFFFSFLFSPEYDFTQIGASIGLLIFLIIVYKLRAFPMQLDFEDIVLDSIDDVLISYDNAYRLVYNNLSAAKLFDKDNAFTYGITLKNIYPALDQFLDLKAGEVVKFGDRTFACEILDIKNGDDIIGCIQWLRDISKEQLYINEANELKSEAENANKAKSSFLAHMSHEIRTPMNAILGMDELIIRESQEENIKTYAGNIKRAGKTLLALINDILDFSKIEAGKMEIVNEPYNVPSMINDLALLTEMRVRDNNISFEVDVDPNVPAELKGDDVRVKQVITNLLTNAVKYTHKGGVTFSVKAEQFDRDTVMLIAVIKDTGVGIKNEDLHKLFERFERIETEENHQTEGTGLGMSITTQLLELMGGTLEVESVYGQGTTFTVSIPQKLVNDKEIGNFDRTELENSDAVFEKNGTYTAPDADILIVDDTNMNLTIATALLKNSLIRFDTATSGVECLEKIRAKRYDIIFLDNRMGELSGVETLKLMRKDTNHKCNGVPVVAMTADAGEGAKDYFVGEGFADYISKPMVPRIYEEMIARLLPAEKVHYVK